MDTRENKKPAHSDMDTNEQTSKRTMEKFNQILSDYEEMFGTLPPIPKCGSYSTIADLMEDALIAKQPVKVEDILEAFENVKCDLV